MNEIQHVVWIGLLCLESNMTRETRQGPTSKGVGCDGMKCGGW